MRINKIQLFGVVFLLVFVTISCGGGGVNPTPPTGTTAPAISPENPAADVPVVPPPPEEPPPNVVVPDTA